MNDPIFQHPVFQNLDPVKLEFLTQFMQQEKPSKMTDAMPFLMAQMMQAKKKNLSFTKEEIQLITEIITQNMSEKDRKRIMQAMKMLGN